MERYLEKKPEAGGSRATIKPVLEDFVEFCEREDIDSVAALDSGDCREYGLELREKYIDGEIAGLTANTDFTSVRTFPLFCVRDELLDTNPAQTESTEEFLPEDRPTGETVLAAGVTRPTARVRR